MLFPLGKPILVMGVLSILAGSWLSLQGTSPRKDLTLWVFATPQYHEYQNALRPAFEQQSGKSVEIDLIPARAMDMRLPVLFMSPGSAHDLPDAVEVEIGSMGLYLRPPVDQIGFLPLNRFLETSGFREISSLEAPGRPGWNARLGRGGPIYTFDGQKWQLNLTRAQPDAWIDRLLSSRFASSTKDGEIFGLPHDVHPVALAFRDDLFRQAGVPLIDDAGMPTVSTWPQLQEKCVKFQDYWRLHGCPTRHAIELSQTSSGMLSIMLAQRHIHLVDADYSNHLNDPIVAQTLAFYVQLVAGEREIATDSGTGSGLEYKDFSDGNICALLMPDWKVDSFRQYAPQLAGKMRMIPLPRFDSTDAPTASYGGTLMCIPRGTPKPEDAWRLVEFLYLSPQGLADRKRLGIIPPLPEEWDNPDYHRPDPYFGGQKSLELYTELARCVPRSSNTPIDTMALLTLQFVQSRAVGYVRSHGVNGLQEQCQLWLDIAAGDLQRRIKQARFE